MFSRGYVDIRNTGTVLGEEEAIWLLKLVLPYLNEFLLKLRALFSGDPATTMKVSFNLDLSTKPLLIFIKKKGRNTFSL